MEDTIIFFFRKNGLTRFQAYITGVVSKKAINLLKAYWPASVQTNLILGLIKLISKAATLEKLLQNLL